jgi:hypothetical protein
VPYPQPALSAVPYAPVTSTALNHGTHAQGRSGGVHAASAQPGATPVAASLDSRVTRAMLPSYSHRYVFDEATGEYVPFDPSHGVHT